MADVDVEFLPEEPDEPGALMDALDSGRRYPLLLNALLAAVLVAGGIGWFASRPNSPPAKPPAPTRTHGPPPSEWYENALAGCPDTLACDSNHQVQQHVINMVKAAIRQGQVAARATYAAPLTHAGRGGIGRIFVIP